MIYGPVAQTGMHDSRWCMSTAMVVMGTPYVGHAVIEQPLYKRLVGGSIPPRTSHFKPGDDHG